MSTELPNVPVGSAKHPVQMIVIAANKMAESSAFYAKVFGWQMLPMSEELTVAMVAEGPSVTLRSNVPDGFQGVVPFLSVPKVETTLEQVVAAGGAIEREPWAIPMVGKMARFTDPSGTVYGLTSGMSPGKMTKIPAPFGNNPKPMPNTVGALEMYMKSAAIAASFFGDVFGWGTLETMPSYLAFDPGVGVTGVFQSHTPTLPAVAYLYVNDVVTKIAEIEVAGGKRLSEPMPVPGMATFGYFKDPSGTSMGLLGP